MSPILSDEFSRRFQAAFKSGPMSNNSEEEIKEKLRLLEAEMKEGLQNNLPAKQEKSQNLSSTSTNLHLQVHEGSASKADMHLLGGATGMLIGIVAIFANLEVSSWGFPALMAGGGGNGILLLMLIVGFGFFIYDYKNKIAWLLMLVGLATLLLSLFANLHVHFAAMNMFSFLLIVLPLAIGGGLIAKGMKMHNQIQSNNKALQKKNNQIQENTKPPQ